MYANAVGAIAGMLGVEPPASELDKPLITASMFGNTTACVDRARGVLTDHGYEVLVFHATGIGGQTMEGMIADGYIAACLDITTTGPFTVMVSVATRRRRLTTSGGSSPVTIGWR